MPYAAGWGSWYRKISVPEVCSQDYSTLHSHNWNWVYKCRYPLRLLELPLIMKVFKMRVVFSNETVKSSVYCKLFALPRDYAH